MPRRQNNAEAALHDQSNRLSLGQLILVLCTLSGSLLVVFIDQNAIGVALLTISRDLGAESTIAWAGAASLIGNTMFSVLYGRLSDIFSRKTVYIATLVSLCISDLLCGFAQNPTMFYVFRGFAGTAGGGVTSLTTIIVSDIVALEDRGKYQGILGSIIGLANVTGPFIAAVFVEKSTWRGFFYLIAPISGCGAVVAYFLVPNKMTTKDIWKSLGIIDYLGAVTSSLGVIFLLIPVSGGGDYFAWDSALVISMLAVGGLMLVLFIVIEWKVAVLPMLPLSFFKNRTVAALLVQTFLLGASYQSYMYYLPLYFQNARQWSPFVSAAMILPMVIPQSLASISGGQYMSLVKRFSEVLWTGYILWTLGAGLALLFNNQTSKGVIAGVLIVIGLGIGFTFQPGLIAIQSHVTLVQQAVVIPERNFFRCFGGACEVAISAAILQEGLKANLPDRDKYLADSTYTLPSRSGIPEQDWTGILNAYARSSHDVFILQVPLMALCLLSCVLVRDDGLQTKDGRAQRQHQLTPNNHRRMSDEETGSHTVGNEGK
ncbi:putative MFS transporter [Aspergillus sclerotioniger CBS 115572]|uniref:Putative MFS transporter n=1 Tax=Aspergillus sclerotioniger CBS 115572 TaxID=1450535 RepID=A0A317VVR8_9EURO|nr:putative MFS transporter [Aspergillus sclerotioniger CBS 115572]PWY76000.1 putative MFS transporter [Aspergillus sclerotioniger CBS 115572]